MKITEKILTAERDALTQLLERQQAELHQTAGKLAAVNSFLAYLAQPAPVKKPAPKPAKTP
jgi:hypothetical protein